MSEKFNVEGEVEIKGEVEAEKKGAGEKSLEEIVKEQVARRGERRPGETPEQYEKRMQEDELGLRYEPESDNPPGAPEISEDLTRAREEANEAFEK